jgi:hypothetical protein
MAQHEASKLRRQLDEVSVATRDMRPHVDMEVRRLTTQLAKMEEELVEKDGAILELRFEREQSTVNIGRLQRRLKELQGHNEYSNVVREQDKHDASAKDGSAKREKELEDTVVSLKKLCEKQRLENESLRRNTQSNVQFMEMKKENKGLKSRIEQLEEQVCLLICLIVGLDRADRMQRDTCDHMHCGKVQMRCCATVCHWLNPPLSFVLHWVCADRVEQIAPGRDGG